MPTPPSRAPRQTQYCPACAAHLEVHHNVHDLGVCGDAGLGGRDLVLAGGCSKLVAHEELQVLATRLQPWSVVLVDERHVAQDVWYQHPGPQTLLGLDDKVAFHGGRAHLGPRPGRGFGPLGPYAGVRAVEVGVQVRPVILARCPHCVTVSLELVPQILLRVRHLLRDTTRKRLGAMT
jgi:hypothetical protein